MNVYSNRFKQWTEYAYENSYNPLPAMQDCFSLYLIDLVHHDQKSWQVVHQIVSAVNFFHTLYHFEIPSSLVDDRLVKEFCFKYHKKRSRKKRPLFLSEVKEIVKVLNFSSNDFL